jgi:hypothetical protein
VAQRFFGLSPATAPPTISEAQDVKLQGFLAHRSLSRSEDGTEIRAGEESAEKVVKDIRRATRRHFSAEDKIRIVLEGLRGEESIVELCRREGIVQNLYYRWSKDFSASARDTWRVELCSW